MTAKQFRRLALDLPEVVESSHQAHPDFRFQNRIFATLGYPNHHWGMVRLTPEQQTDVLSRQAETFQPAAGAWDRRGSTLVLLSAIEPAALRPILRQAYDNLAGKKTRRSAH